MNPIPAAFGLLVMTASLLLISFIDRSPATRPAGGD